MEISIIPRKTLERYFLFYYSTFHGDSLLLEFPSEKEATEHIENELELDPFLKREHMLLIKGEKV